MSEKFSSHPQAIVDSKNIGDDTRVWAFAHVLAGAVIGRNCNICDFVFIENDVVVGNDVTIKCGVYVWDGLRIEDNAFVGPSVVFTNDRTPRSKAYQADIPRTIIGEGASLGAGAVILPGLTVGQYAMVGAGAVVTKSVAAFELVFGNPARHQGFVCRCSQRLDFRDDRAACECGLKYELRDGKVCLI